MATGQSKQHKKAEQAKEKFIPSIGNEDYLKSNKKEVSAKSILQLRDEINLGYADGLALAQKATSTMIEVGRLLIEARTLFKSDKEFGQWRKKSIEFSQSHCQRLMAVTKEFGDDDNAKLLPISSLSELLPASSKLKKEIINEVIKGEKPTVKEIREEVKQEKDPSPTSGDKKKVTSVMTPPDIEPWEIAQNMLDAGIGERIERYNNSKLDLTDAFIIFGIPPYHEGQPSQDILDFLYVKWSEDFDGEPEALILDAAYEIIMELY